MGQFNSLHLPISIRNTPMLLVKRSRACSRLKARAVYSPDELSPVPDSSHAAAASHRGAAPPSAGNPHRSVTAHLAAVRDARRRPAAAGHVVAGRGATVRRSVGEGCRARHVAGIHKALDAGGFSHVPIMSYAAKFASAFYGPFREAAGSTPQFGDRQTYQMAVANGDEAMKEIQLDLDEGADIVMVKPAGPCLDLIRRAKDRFGSPPRAYQASGEYAMIKTAAGRGMLDEARAMWESVTAIRRGRAGIHPTLLPPA